MNWKWIVMSILPMLRMAGMAKRNEDDNNTGKDDLIGVSLIYAADLLEAILSDKQTLPKVPDALK